MLPLFEEVAKNMVTDDLWAFARTQILATAAEMTRRLARADPDLVRAAVEGGTLSLPANRSGRKRSTKRKKRAIDRHKEMLAKKAKAKEAAGLKRPPGAPKAPP